MQTLFVKAPLVYSQIKIDRKLISLYSLQSKIGVHLLNGELTQLLTPLETLWEKGCKKINLCETVPTMHCNRIHCAG